MHSSLHETLKSENDLRDIIVPYACGLRLQLREFRENAAQLRVAIGTEEELQDLKVNTKEMEDFSKAVDETTVSQTKEIRQLQKSTYENFTWVEEAKSRRVRNNDPRYRNT